MHFHLASCIRPVVCLTQLASFALLPGSSVVASLVISGEIAAMRIETVMISRCRAVIGSFQFMRYLRASSLWRVRFGSLQSQIGHIPLSFSHLSIELSFALSYPAGLFSFIFFTFSFIYSLIYTFTYETQTSTTRVTF